MTGSLLIQCVPFLRLAVKRALRQATRKSRRFKCNKALSYYYLLFFLPITLHGCRQVPTPTLTSPPTFTPALTPSITVTQSTPRIDRLRPFPQGCVRPGDPIDITAEITGEVGRLRCWVKNRPPGKGKKGEIIELDEPYKCRYFAGDPGKDIVCFGNEIVVTKCITMSIMSPSPTPSPPITPTITPTPTITLTPTPTITPTLTPVPPPPTPPYPAPTLLWPPNKAELGGDQWSVKLKWRYNGQLGCDEYFDVRVWKEGAPLREMHKGVAWEKGTSYVASRQLLSSLPGKAGSRKYYWTIVVIRGKLPPGSVKGQWKNNLSDPAKSEVWVFYWTDPGPPSPRYPPPW